MAESLRRGDIWLLDLGRPDKRRPVLVLSRSSLIESLHTVTVAAITSTLRGSRTEVALGMEHGLKHPSCVNLCNLFTVRQADLHSYVGSIESRLMKDVCAALEIACGCE
jgi:mRNA interferase MazF